jgi:hypothetical protein
MSRGRIKSLGHDPDASRVESMPYDPNTVKQIVATGKLV